MSGAKRGEEYPERITVLSKEFTPAAMEYHRRAMSQRGYRLDGAITPRRFQMIEGLGEPKDLFDGATFYAVTFIRDPDAGVDG
ncbi:MAG: AMP nucleosidase [Alphaproteobacteria bacterium]|nr:AMP nucleosidase [Alphaproteobacteria bacterium]